MELQHVLAPVLHPALIVSSLPIIFGGFLMSVAIVLAAFPLAIPFGFLFALMRISKSRILRALAAVYVNLIRGTPAFLQIYIAFFGLPLAGVNIDNYTLGVIVMAMNSAAYLCE
ncbi:MAG: ABC transporter permease subunit, partial [Eggerthellaceae bacterium]